MENIAISINLNMDIKLKGHARNMVQAAMIMLLWDILLVLCIQAHKRILKLEITNNNMSQVLVLEADTASKCLNIKEWESAKVLTI